MNDQRLPLDVDALKPGDVVTPEDLARGWPNVKPQARAVAALAWVRAQFAMRGIGLTVRTKRGALVVLTMEQAVKHGGKASRQFVKRALHAHVRQGNLDTRLMTEAQRKQHDKNLVKNGLLMGGFARVVDRLSADEAARTQPPQWTPKLPKVT